ncbi:MAG: polysaccharide deacetylase family protein [Saccharofermentanales bacterium]
MSFKVIFGIDMENDVGSYTPFYNGVQKGTPTLLKLFNEKKIKATFFFTGDAAVKNENIVKMVLAEGHEIGCHSLYHETIGDEIFPMADLKPLLPEEVAIRLRIATQWVADVSGTPPLSFRCPRLWGSTAVLNMLESLGYLVDASYPMYFYKKQFMPYHPSRENWLETGDMKILEIPNFADMLMESNDKPYERDRDPWQIYRTKGAEFTMEYIENFLKFTRQKDIDPVLCFYLHPWEFYEMPESFDFGEATVIPRKFITEGCGQKAHDELSKLIDYIKEIGGEFYKAIEMVNYY